jgi:hypothetical protein
MRVTQAHVRNHQEIMAERRALRNHAASQKPRNEGQDQGPRAFLYNLSEPQLAHLWPGLIRVEVLPKDKSRQRIQREIDPIPVANTSRLMIFGTTNIGVNQTIPSWDELLDAKPCCHTQHHAPTINNGNPTPNGTELMTWETGILGMSVRPIPSLGWVALLSGPDQDEPYSVPGFDATRYYSSGPPSKDDAPPTSRDWKTQARAPKMTRDAAFLAQSAGWMASPRDILELHHHLCVGGFLPPFSHKDFPRDGLQGHNVEFWSGGLQLWCGKCNMQRILLLDPLHFSKHLIYHTANNKQRMIDQRRLVRVTDLMGQLYTIQQQAANLEILPQKQTTAGFRFFPMGDIR